MPRPIPPEINHPGPGAPLLVGRDPGRTSILPPNESRLLFGGYDSLTGTHQQGAIAHAGLDRSSVNITNRVPYPAWNGDFHRHSWDAINEGERQLRSLIDDLQPSIILAMGAEACYDLVPNWRGLTDRQLGDDSGGASIKSAKNALDRRGFLWYPDETGLPCPVLATLHPSTCLWQAMPNRVLLDIDFTRMGAVLRGELPRRDWPEPTRILTSADLAPLWEADLVSYDIEITWGGDRFLCIAFYTSDGHAFLAYEDGLGACEEWLRSDRPKLAHNSQFDRYFLEARCGIPVGGRHEDTICAHWACYPELAGKPETGREDQRKSTSSTMTRKGLNFLASFHLNVPWWKTYTSDRALMGQLCVNDVAATLWAWDEIEPELEAMGVRPQYERQISMLPSLIAVQKRGFRIDEDMRQERMRKLTERQERLEAESREAALTFLQEHSITHREDGTEYWWYHDARCECCFGGTTKSAHCDACAGVRGTGSGGSILKGDLVLALWRAGHEKADLDALKKDELVELLPPCKPCNGRGTTPRWDFNPMSPSQMPALLWEHLDVPKYCYRGSPSADEETLRRALEWAEDQ